MSTEKAQILTKPTGYPLYDEIRDFLAECERLYPGFCRVHPIGRSYEGREIMCCELTNHATGDAADKPAYHLDANHHAGEVTGAATALYTIWYLLTGYGQEEICTRLLDEQVFYVIPRVAVDGSEVYLTTPEMLRSSVRPYPEPEEKPGLYPADVDGDGQILAMRVPDPSGSWKISAHDPRLMVKRAPGEDGGTYYRIYTEGLIREYDGVEIPAAPPKWGLDFNRNYPGTWAPEHIQRGAGPFPASEPEVRAVVEFMHSRPNIAGAMSHHTMGGMILRAHCAKPDEQLPRADVAVMKALGEIGMQRTGYPIWSIYEEFTIDKDRPPVGSWMDWAYDLLGCLPLATELWDMAQHAGLPKLKPKEAMARSSADHEQAQLAMLRWNDKVIGGRGFVRWRPFEHPQLGPVEIGGWLPKTAWQNPPVELLEGECHKATLFTLDHAAVAPRLEIEEFTASELGTARTGEGASGAGGGDGPGDGGGGGEARHLYKVTAVLHNRGYLPTHVTEQALRTKVAKPIRVQLSCDAGGDAWEAVSGKADDEVGHLPGHGSAAFMWGYQTPETRKKLEWVIAAPAGSRLTLKASAPKCGVRVAEVVL